MRKGLLGSIAALATGAGAAWGQPVPPAPAGDPPPPAAVAPAGDVIPVNGPILPPALQGLADLARPTPPAPVIMPPLSFGPPGDPQGLGPVAGSGPPPGPMYPNPGAYAAPNFQPGPPAPSGLGGSTGGAPHWWFGGEYLLWYSKAQPATFPLLTTSAPADRGLLGRSSTLSLVGQKDLTYNPISGFRLSGGFFYDADRRKGFEFSGFALERRTVGVDVSASPAGIPTLARPFIDSASPNAFSSLVLANPNFGGGRVVVTTSSELWGAEGNKIINLYRSEPGCACSWSLDVLAGYRYLELTEDVQIRSATYLTVPPVATPVFQAGPFGVLTQVGTTATPVPVPFGGLTVFNPATVLVLDSFKVTNRFNGGQVGARGEVRYGMFTVSGTGKFAIGNMNQRLEIQGASAFADLSRPRAPFPNAGMAYGGLYANAANIGRYSHDEFAIIPEATLNVGLNVTRGLTAFAGYNFMYIDNVARPMSQINPIVNSATVPFSPNYGAQGRPNVPQQFFVQDEYWVMGVNFGLMLRY